MIITHLWSVTKNINMVFTCCSTDDYRYSVIRCRNIVCRTQLCHSCCLQPTYLPGSTSTIVAMTTLCNGLLTLVGPVVSRPSAHLALHKFSRMYCRHSAYFSLQWAFAKFSNLVIYIYIYIFIYKKL